MNVANILIGKPISTEDAKHQTIGKAIGLAVFASDALSSTAYATEEILVVLAGAAALVGTQALSLSIPIAVAIVALLAVVTISYRQTIFAYPGGGGAYIVARDNLGELPAQIAGAALLTDYILTVAVSVSSGVDQVTSAIPLLLPYQVILSVAAVLLMSWVNMRGVKESGRIFALPAYFFIAAMVLTLGVGFFKMATGTLGTVQGVEMIQHSAENIGVFLILHAFSSGCTALTGVEAISNGVTAFKEPRGKNAANTMLAMSLILGTLFIGITVLSSQIQALPSDTETIISQLGRTVFGLGPLYGLMIASTTVILIMAANTAYADFPRLCALHAGDGFLPRQLTFKGSRLVFSWGIVVLTAASVALIIIFNAKTSRLIPLYAIGVFLSFTLSQMGMVRRWQRVSKIKLGEELVVNNPHGDAMHLQHDPHWRVKQIVNAFGGVMTLVVMLVFATTKFVDGAWVTVILVPTMVFIFFRIHKHYKDVASALSLEKHSFVPSRHNLLNILMVDDVHAGTVGMVSYAMSQASPWIAVHIDNDPNKTAKIKDKWDQRMTISAHQLEMVPCPYRNITEVAVAFIQKQLTQNPDLMINVIMGQIIMDTWAGQALHANTSIAFKLALQRMPHVIVTDVSYQIHAPEAM